MVLLILKSREINETQDTEDKTKAEYVFLIISYTLPFTTSKSSIVAVELNIILLLCPSLKYR